MMTQEEKLLARLKSLGGGLHEIQVYVSPSNEVVFWVVENTKQVEGERRTSPEANGANVGGVRLSN